MKPLDRQPNVSFEKVLQSIAMGNTHPDVVSTLVSRLIRIEKSFTEDQKKVLEEISGIQLKQLCHNIVEATEEDVIVKAVREKHNLKPDEEHTTQQYEDTRKELVKSALRPVYDPKYREKILEIKKDNEQIIDPVSLDVLMEWGFSEEAKTSAKNLINNFQEFLEEHKDELELVKAYYSKSYKNRISYKDLKEFTTHIEAKPLLSRPELIWNAFRTMYPEKVMETDQFSTTDFIPMIEFMGHNKAILQPYKYTINEKYEERLEQRKAEGEEFSSEQL
jgi:type I restriction enzyme, R subunit